MLGLCTFHVTCRKAFTLFYFNGGSRLRRNVQQGDSEIQMLRKIPKTRLEKLKILNKLRKCLLCTPRDSSKRAAAFFI